MVRYKGEFYVIYRTIRFQGVVAGYAIAKHADTQHYTTACVAVNDPDLHVF